MAACTGAVGFEPEGDPAGDRGPHERSGRVGAVVEAVGDLPAGGGAPAGGAAGTGDGHAGGGPGGAGRRRDVARGGAGGDCARAPAAGGRLLGRRRGDEDERLDRVAAAAAVDPSQRGGVGPGRHPRGAECGARGPRRGQVTHHRVPGRAAPEPAQRRGAVPGGRARSGEDVTGAVHGPGARARVREAGLRGAAGRVGPAGPQPDLAGFAAGLDPARAAAGGQPGPGVRARRAGQDRPRAGGGAARGARPATEQGVPRRVRGAALRSVGGAVHHDGERGVGDPGGVAGPSRGHRACRLQRGREGLDRADAPGRGGEPGRGAVGAAGAVHGGGVAADHPRAHARAGCAGVRALPADGLPQGGAGSGDGRRVAGARAHHGAAGPRVARRPGVRSEGRPRRPP